MKATEQTQSHFLDVVLIRNKHDVRISAMTSKTDVFIFLVHHVHIYRTLCLFVVLPIFALMFVSLMSFMIRNLLFDLFKTSFKRSIC